MLTAGRESDRLFLLLPQLVEPPGGAQAKRDGIGLHVAVLRHPCTGRQRARLVADLHEFIDGLGRGNGPAGGVVEKKFAAVRDGRATALNCWRFRCRKRLAATHSRERNPRGPRVASARSFHMTGHSASPSPPRLPPLRRLGLVTPAHALGENFRARVVQDVGDIADVSSRQVHPPSGLVADADSAGPLATGFKEIASRQLNARPLIGSPCGFGLA
jgi:hypothetical protein